jgi:hypothetical protein
MNWRVLQLFLAHPNAELTVLGVRRLAAAEYPQDALTWSLRSLERRGFLYSRRPPGGQRRYWLTEAPDLRAALQICLDYFGKPCDS